MKGLALFILLSRLLGADTIVYLRPGKTGSSSVVDYMKILGKYGRCANLRYQFHDTVFLPVNNSSYVQGWHWKGGRARPIDGLENWTTFTILRDPCERIVSIFRHLRHWNNALGYKVGGEIVMDMSNTSEWIERLNTNNTALNLMRWPWPRNINFRNYVVGFPQSYYVGPNTRVFCLNDKQLSAKLGSYFAEYSCEYAKKRPFTLHANVNTNVSTDETIDSKHCDIVHRIYRRDYELWQEHCAATASPRADEAATDIQELPRWPAASAGRVASGGLPAGSRR